MLYTIRRRICAISQIADLMFFQVQIVRLVRKLNRLWCVVLYFVLLYTHDIIQMAKRQSTMTLFFIFGLHATYTVERMDGFGGTV